MKWTNSLFSPLTKYKNEELTHPASNIENILINNLNLEFVILSLIAFNIFFVRFMLKNYKDYIKNIIKVLIFDKLNIEKLVNNILVYNLKFYNIIAVIVMFMIIIFKIVIIYTIFHLYFDSLNYVVQYMLFYKNISLKEGTNEVVLNAISFLNNSNLENILLYLGINNLIIILLFLFNIILYFKNKLNKNILIISLLLYLIGIFINFYYLFDLNQNIKNYISDYIDLHITLNSSILLFKSKTKTKTKSKSIYRYIIKLYSNDSIKDGKIIDNSLSNDDNHLTPEALNDLYNDFPLNLLPDINQLLDAELLFLLVILNIYVVKFISKIDYNKYIFDNKLGIILKKIINRYIIMWSKSVKFLLIFSWVGLFICVIFSKIFMYYILNA